MKHPHHFSGSTSINKVLAAIHLRVPLLGKVTAEELRKLLEEILAHAEANGIRVELASPSSDRALLIALLGAGVGVLLGALTAGGTVAILVGAGVGAGVGAAVSCIRLTITPQEPGAFQLAVA
jgi:hypothetical protein